MLRFPDLNSWLTYLETQQPKLDLERVSQVAERLNLLPFNCPIITVAGTNGKGSCVALLEAVFIAAGYRVGAYTSPHLHHYTERNRINRNEIPAERICHAFACIEEARGEIPLTYFEFGTLAVLLNFKDEALDVAILEVGMGGRLDAVNIVDPSVAIISTIALDHMEWLGTDRETIGREKAGIMRSQKPVVCGDFATPKSVSNHASDIGAKLYCQNANFGYQEEEAHWQWWSENQRLMNLPKPKIELQNAATVLKALELLPPELTVDRTAIENGLREVFIPGRFQIHAGPVTRIFDVAHNPAAAKLLAKQLQKTAIAGRTIAVVAMLNDKDMLGTVTALRSEIEIWHVAGLTVARGGPAKILADILEQAGVKDRSSYNTVTDAYRAALAQAEPGDRIITFGSFHTVAEAMQVGL